MSGFAKFQIELKAGDKPAVKVDGNEVPGVVGLRIYQDDPFDFPTVALEARATEIELIGEGNVAVSLGQSIIEFLEDQDPKDLEAAALGLGLGRPITASILDVLKERADAPPT